MMRSLLMLTFLLFLGGTAAIAQQRDTTATEQQTQQQAVPSGMTEIQASEVPAPVTEALQSANYTGWESGKFYKSESSDLYMVEIGEGGQTRQHFFDKNGTPAARPQDEE